MNFPDRSPTKDRLLGALTILVDLAYFGVFALINFHCFAYFCEPDMYADTLVARLMWEEKTLFPLGYVFGNQLYVIATPVLSALFYGLGASQNTAMALATTAMSLLIVISFLWMLRPFVKKRLSLWAALLMLLSCVFGEKLVNQEQGQLFFILCSYYACYVITLFVTLGDYVRTLRDPAPRWRTLVPVLLLCFATGMQSLRQTCIMVLPILALQGALLAGSRLRSGSFRWEKYRVPLLRSLAYAGANLAGVGAIKLFDVHQYTIFDSTPQGMGQRLGDIYLACRDVSGFCWTGPEHPFFTLLFVFQAALLIYAAVLQVKGLRSFPRLGALQLLWWLLVISIGAVIAAALFTSLSIRSVYLFTYYPLLALSAALVLERLKPAGGYGLTLLLCALALGNLYSSYVPSIQEAEENQENYYREISRWAVENGYEFVYGSHSNAAPMIAAWSDGELISGSWSDVAMFKVQEYLNLQNIYSADDAEKAILVFKPYELEYAFEANAAAREGDLVFQGRYGDLYVFTCIGQMLYPRTYPWFEKQWPDWGN